MKYTILILAAITLFSCKQTNEPELKTAPSQQKAVVAETRDLNVTEERVAVTFTTEVATMMHGAYDDLKGAFVNTDAEEAAAIAGEFKQMTEGISEDEFFKALQADLETISNSIDIATQRVAFEGVSKKVENYLSDKVGTGAIIKQYCPMAFDGKGAYWLSDSKEIRNPYYGDKMLKCGVVDKELQ